MKVKISRRSLIWFVVCCTVLIAGVICWYLFENKDVLVDNEVDGTTLEIENKAAIAINDYDYYLAVIDILKTTSDGSEFSSQEAFSCARDDSYRSYMYRDSDDNDLYQCWYFDTEKNTYPTYVYSEDVLSWVETSMSSPYNAIDGWTLFKDLSYYTVSEETGIWEASGDECIVLHATNTEVMGMQIYEEVYIRKSDYLPMGIITYGSVEVAGVETSETTVGENDVVVETAARDEIIQIISVEYSKEDLRLFDIPEEYISEKEYAERMGSVNVEEE